MKHRFTAQDEAWMARALQLAEKAEGDQELVEARARRDQAAELIKADGSDIIGIQEGLPPMLNDLADRVPGYAVIGEASDGAQLLEQVCARWPHITRLLLTGSQDASPCRLCHRNRQPAAPHRC